MCATRLSLYRSALFSLLLAMPIIAALSTDTAIANVLLSFDAPVASTIPDTNALGTGFTHRLPGTGGSIPVNDPNLNLLSMPGYLSFRSTRSDINQLNGFGRNLGALDAPGVLLSGMVGQDFRVTAKFDDVQVPDLSDQLLLYVGTK